MVALNGARSRWHSYSVDTGSEHTDARKIDRLLRGPARAQRTHWHAPTGIALLPPALPVQGLGSMHAVGMEQPPFSADECHPK